MDERRRRELARYGAPAAFLAAATIAILLIKAGLGGSTGSEATPTAGALPTVPTTTAAPTRKVTVTTPPPASTAATTTTATQYYTVASGDTLGSIAATYSTSVDELLRLNPGVDPHALHIGQKIRVS
jgi:LysM repeat protein